MTPLVDLHDEGDKKHPLRKVESCREVPNAWDGAYIAVEFTLECGHVCVITGSKVYNVTGVHCKECSHEVAGH